MFYVHEGVVEFVCIHIYAYIYTYIHTYIHTYTHTYTCTICMKEPTKVRRGNRTLELEIQRMGAPIWMLGTEPGLFGRVVMLISAKPSL